ncbi:hypothetical protein T190130A13A_20059 [Tenacibaculum sp. 190130A14a]|uniref:Uncharacterized protein n=1 Tax=Tenacibaculum polynesiense TaxID=3137857 RepID=A0ABP1EV20_9FLAO
MVLRNKKIFLLSTFAPVGFLRLNIVWGDESIKTKKLTTINLCRAHSYYMFALFSFWYVTKIPSSLLIL